ncbi:MAG: nitrogenase iron-molybdenum cofactor biosynthesis protein NifE [Chitinivibrionales bacterium]|nr:nitrogenase iron-molybdenum cofactor biosynthesis protein NifE [Chitinivibrionales bacterium]MBD3358771.1 nitrogenase iron-molybdenum cofactor biosynthesis protein NifE [Chitinivibrionales bacterium]
MRREDLPVLDERRPQITRKGRGAGEPACEKMSVAGTVSQRACVFCGARVVLYPIADAVHLIHGPIGCAAYTWDIRGALSSGPQLHRKSFSTDLREKDVIYGGEDKLRRALTELIEQYKPNAAFVYSTCIVGLIGDDVEALCRKFSALTRIPVIPVNSPGFGGTKKTGYKAACDALARLVGTAHPDNGKGFRINILGDFNIAGETWIIADYYRRMGVDVVATITGDGRISRIRKAHGAHLNVVQCSGSMIHLARYMEEKYGIPYIRVSYFGIEDTAEALYAVARHFNDPSVMERSRTVVAEEVAKTTKEIDRYRRDLAGKRAAVYTGGAFKAFSLVKSLRMLGMETVLVGSQTGNSDDYRKLREICTEGTILVDDAGTLELARFMVEQQVDLFIGGVKERPIAYKLGIGFCDHNHERKIALAGFAGMVHFVREVHKSVMSPVWQFVRRRGEGASSC